MKIINVTQGSAEWHQHRATHFNASDAPAMMGVSKYKTRNQLLHEMATGIMPEFDQSTQDRFDEGHRAEALARPIAEEIIGEDLYPVTGTNGRYSASFDGLTMAEDVCFEHKSLNNELRQVKEAADLHPQYRIQMEHQLMVSGAEKCLFMASKFDDQDMLIEKVIVWYEPDMELRAQIIAGWEQLDREGQNYVAPVIVEAPKAHAVMELPALLIQAKGEITTSNMREFGEALTARLEFVRSIQLVTDQDFSNAEAAAKQFRETCDKLKLAKSQMLEQTVTIGEAARMIDAWHEDLRLTALKLEKDVGAEKEAKKIAIISAAKAEYADHINALEAEIKPIRLNLVAPDFAGAMKGKRLLSAWHDAVSTALANAKVEADIMAKDYRGKLAWCKETSEGYGFLFSDLSTVITKQEDDFKLLVTSRIDAHKKAEADKLEAQRVAMQKEEERKAALVIEAEKQRIQREAEAKDRAEQEAIATAERKRVQEETRKAIQVAAEAEEARLLELAKNAQVSHQEPLSITKEQKQAAVVESGDVIAEFLKSRHFADENKVRAILVEFIKFNAEFSLRTAA